MHIMVITHLTDIQQYKYLTKLHQPLVLVGPCVSEEVHNSTVTACHPVP